MFLQERANGHLVEILSLRDLFDPFHDTLVGRYHQGEEMQDPGKYKKTDLVFPSGEDLPRCWQDPAYREKALRR